MTLDSILALLVFAFVTSVTPGPNNLMLMTSGANFGVRRTVPHMLGISLGHAFMVFLVGVGIEQVFRRVPGLDLGLKVAAVGYMLWLAWKFAHAAAPGDGRVGARPLTFLQAAAFQWVNPKAWAMALGAVAAYVPQPSVPAFAVLALVFCAVNLPSVAVWAFAGQGVRRLLSTPRRLKAFNTTMAALLVASLIPVLLA